MREVRPSSTALGLVAALAAACSQITSETVIRTTVRPDARPLVNEVKVVAVAVEARWAQRGGNLEVELRELRSCQTVAHLAARQEERIVRKPDAMIYFEYGLAAVALGVSALAFARPELFAAEASYDEDRMQYVRDLKTGRRVGGVFTAVGLGLLTAGIVDSVRARDRVHVSDTVALREGPVQPCSPPDGPASGRAVELVIGERVLASTADAEGRVRFSLPAEPEMSSETDSPPRALAATLRIGFAGALPISLVTPYAHTADAPHTGTTRSGPQ
ncbi:hypothetical protein [Nannocystis punicea]|uniref:Lipoprotein n=1 Tax=Nannocystis punicea TaxID=2995304 RepID=A0ABY7H414_9BACT|nr:hypothetical protein [Nannocystis poenicansa]WAS94016.1 hypothetical protein O0S08_48430 [Nannocystis poenicansa]